MCDGPRKRAFRRSRRRSIAQKENEKEKEVLQKELIVIKNSPYHQRKKDTWVRTVHREKERETIQGAVVDAEKY